MDALIRNISAVTGALAKSGSTSNCTLVVALPKFCTSSAFKASVSLSSPPYNNRASIFFLNNVFYANYQPSSFFVFFFNLLSALSVIRTGP